MGKGPSFRGRWALTGSAKASGWRREAPYCEAPPGTWSLGLWASIGTCKHSSGFVSQDDSSTNWTSEEHCYSWLTFLPENSEEQKDTKQTPRPATLREALVSASASGGGGWPMLPSLSRGQDPTYTTTSGDAGGGGPRAKGARGSARGGGRGGVRGQGPSGGASPRGCRQTNGPHGGQWVDVKGWVSLFCWKTWGLLGASWVGGWYWGIK